MDDMDAAQTLADVVAAYLLNAHARDELLAAFELLQHGTLHDPLTGLVNRVLLQDRIEHAAHLANGSDNVAAILFVNIDDFQLINEIARPSNRRSTATGYGRAARHRGRYGRHSGPICR